MRLSADEQAVRALIERHLGAPVSQHDDQSAPGMHDLTISYPDGRRGAVEVTAAEDQTRRAEVGAIGAEPVLQAPGLNSGWLALLEPGASVKTARRALPDLCAQLETAGVTTLDAHQARPDQGHDVAALHRLLAQAQVVSLRSGTMRPGVIAIAGSMDVQWLSSDPEDVVRFVERFVQSRPADSAKLARSGADERHLFILGGWFPEDWPSLHPLSLDFADLPTLAPSLPEQVTHVWLCAQSERPSRIVMWCAEHGWQQVGTVT